MTLTFKQQTVELIAQELSMGAGKFTGTPNDTLLKKGQLDVGKTARNSLKDVAELTEPKPATSDVDSMRRSVVMPRYHSLAEDRKAALKTSGWS